MSDPVDRLRKALADRYRIKRELGHGGMAVVYLAEDLRHEREVALKVLRPELSAVLGGDRFLQEIRVAAHLQHPHVLPLFDSGSTDGLLFYVMPYVQGESLREKLTRERQLGIDDAIQIATQVANALDYAHRHGVVHRDIKPENILLAEGQALVTDFGIALAVTAAGGSRLTETGLSLGTPQYMSPEQAAADRPLDGRTDIYSVGSVLYEMLTGEPPHTGPTVQAVLARLMTDKPRPITELREAVPPHVALAVHRALAKLPADRFTHATDFAAALATPTSGLAKLGSSLSRTTHAPASWAAVRAGLPLLAIGATLGITAALAASRIARMADRPTAPAHFTISVAAQLLATGASPQFALSPDGSAFVYRGADGRLFLRRLDAPDLLPLPGTEGAGGAISFSPDGRWIVFSQSGQMRKLALGGGSPAGVTEANTGYGVSWADDGTIVFSPAPGAVGLFRLPAAGAPPEQLTAIDTINEVAHAWPQVLPGGDAVLFTALGPSSVWPDASIVVQDLRTGRRKTVVRGSTHGQYVRTGHLLYARSDGTVMAAPFSLRRREVTGPPFPAVSGVQVAITDGAALFAVSDNGTLAFVRGSSTTQHMLRWVDNVGNDRGQVGHPLTGRFPKISPGGEWIAVTVRTPANNDIWLFESRTGRPERLTFDPAEDEYAVWSPDGRQVAYRSARPGGGSHVYVKPIAGSKDPVLVHTRRSHMHLTSWSPDGDWLAFYEFTALAGNDVRVLKSDGTAVLPVAATPANEANPAFSPDGRWLAYDSDETGKAEVYVVSFPGLAGKRQVSIAGGSMPRWASDGSALFYRSGPGLMLLPVSLQEGTLGLGTPQTLFQSDFVEYDVGQDPNRILLMVDNPAAKFAEIHVVLNWFTELRQRERSRGR